MELAGKVLLSVLIVVVGCFIAGFISAWWEGRKKK
ncbi:hypothetical protein ES703_17338 [subsurface metagenome]